MGKVINVEANLYFTSDELGSEVYTLNKECYINNEVNNLDKSKVINLEYHTPAGEGDKHYVDVTFENGIQRRVFNLASVTIKDDSNA